MLERFNFFVSGEKQSVDDFLGEAGGVSSTKQRLDYTHDRLRSLGKGYETYLYEIEHPVLKNIGYHVVRVIVPQLIPLHLIEHSATLDSKRLREVPEKLGYRAATTYNPWPHPFP